jgi:hypothetical protein
MKLISLMTVLSIAVASQSDARTVREVVYRGKVDPNLFRPAMIVSNFYEVGLEKEKNPSFQYKLKSGLSNQNFSAANFKATSFSLVPSINSKLAMALRVEFKTKGPVRVSGEKGLFESELSIEGTRIGSARYEFDLYSLPFQRVYNPKVKQQLEADGEGFQVVEIREIP